MIRVLFICHGNICRSPMAEYILKDLVARKGKDFALQFIIDSAATSSEELGNPMHRGTQKVLEANNIPFKNHIARKLKADELSRWDYFIVMDSANYHNTCKRLGDSSKVYKLLEFAGEDRGVADPWYTGDFDTTFDDIYAGCQGFLSYLNL